MISWEMVYFNKKKLSTGTIYKFSLIAHPNYNFNSTWTSDLHIMKSNMKWSSK